MDWSSLILGADISHYQSRPDFGRLEAAGVRYVIIKATQGTGVDHDYEWNRNEAAKRGMPHLAYPFLQPTDGDAVIKNFLRVAEKAPAALDWEASQSKPGAPAGIVGLWMNACETVQGRAGLAYYGVYPPAPVTGRIARWPRWLPRYPAHLADGPGLPGWDGARAVTDWSTTWMVWQYTGHGRLPGIAPEIDLNRLSCPWDVFRTWYDTGVLPKGAPVGTLPPVPSGVVIGPHATGEAVRALQQRLAALGYVVGVDGDYGPQTRDAVSAFQRDHHLAADGVAGPATVAAVNST